MMEFMILMLILWVLSRIPVGDPEPDERFNPYDNGVADKYALDNTWQFESLEDIMEFRELRKNGWRGNAKDYYEWKGEE